MITIQGFAKLCGCNAQTLRFYDRIGLLTLARVDSWTSYRYYEEEQAVRFVKIKNLQRADFSIEEIKTLLEADEDSLMQAFEGKIAEQQKKLEQIREIQQSYLRETMDMQKMVHQLACFVEGQMDDPLLCFDFSAIGAGIFVISHCIIPEKEAVGLLPVSLLDPVMLPVRRFGTTLDCFFAPLMICAAGRNASASTRPERNPPGAGQGLRRQLKPD